jgi:hypothetical protein
MLTVLGCACSSLAENYIGEKIDNLAKNTNIEKVSQKELKLLVTGKTIKGESSKTKTFGLYFIKHFNADGTFSLEVHKKKNDKLMKKITGSTWFVQPDGTWCTIRDDVKRCNKVVYKLDNVYLSVLKKNGKVNSFWSVEE